jgi:hypothetical protein
MFPIFLAQVAGSNLPLATPSPGDVLFGIHGGILGVGGVTSKFTVLSIQQGGGGGGGSGIALASFDLSGVGPGNALTAIVDRLPLPRNFTPTSIAYVAQAVSGTVSINVAYGEVAITGATAAGATAVAGNAIFATAPVVSGAGSPAFSTPYGAGALYPLGGELTLRVSTSGGGGVSGLRVTIAGNVT